MVAPDDWRTGARLMSAYPTPNLGSGAHAAGIGEAKGTQFPGLIRHPFVVAPEGA
jgi:hypothetical protein